MSGPSDRTQPGGAADDRRDDAAGERPADPGAYIGSEPELAADTIPGGLGPRDERVAAHSTQGTGVGRPDERGQLPREPGGHRDADGIPGEPS